MSEYSSVAPPAQQNTFGQSTAFAAALQRAKQIAAKINPNATGGDNRGKRPLEDGQELNTEPEAKKGPGLPASNQAPPSLNRAPNQGGMGPGNGQHMDEMKVPDKMAPMRVNNVNTGIPGRNSLEIMIPGPKVGLIIGKGGETIKQLQEKSGAKMVVIQDGPSQEHEKPLVISGDPLKIEHAKQLVYDLIAEKEMKSFNRRGGPRHDNRQDQFNEFGGNGGGGSEFEVLVPKPAVGVVIGKGGDMIKKIQAETGARVQFQQNRDEGPGDRRCFLSGNPKQVEQARMRIEELIDSVLQRDGSESGGNGGGGGGGMGSGMRGGRGGGRGGRGGGGGHMGGERYDRNRNGGGGGDYGGNQQWEDRSGSGGRGGGGHHPGGHQGSEVSFMVPANKCGIIIGRGGETIKQINAQSGAYCELDRRTSNQNPNEKTFTIKGDPDQIEAAKRIIQEKVQIPLNFVMSGGPAPMSNNMPTAYPGMAPQGYNPQNSWNVPGGYQQQHWSGQQGGDQVPPQQQQVNVNPSTGQPDYSLQWAEYYRTLGMHREAEVIEQQAKAKQSGGATAAAPAAMGPSTTTAPLGGVPAAAPAAATPGAGGAQPDYSAQWADYYRSIGKVKEAEAIEAQMKNKSATPQAAGGTPGTGAVGGGQAAAAAVAAAAAAAGGYQPSYGAYQPQTGYYGTQPQGVPVPSNVPQGGYAFPGYSGYGQQNTAPPSNQEN